MDGGPACERMYSVTRNPFVDRIWYTEAPNLVVIRPSTRKEKLETELKYWELINDEPRALLAKEILDRLVVDEPKKHELNL